MGPGASAIGDGYPQIFFFLGGEGGTLPIGQINPLPPSRWFTLIRTYFTISYAVNLIDFLHSHYCNLYSA